MSSANQGAEDAIPSTVRTLALLSGLFFGV